MGKTYTAFRDSRTINSNNPASYTAFDTLSFLFDGGISNRFSQWKTINTTQNINHIDLGYLEVGFPIFKKLKVSAGLKPHSKVGYKIIDKEYNEILGTHQFEFEGVGGVNKFHFGIGYEILKGLSLGVNASYLWGTISLNRYSSFPDSAFYWTGKISQKRSLSDFSFTYGVQYEQHLSKQWKLVGGAVFKTKTDVSATEEFLATQISRTNDGTEYVHDTINYIPTYDGTITLPSSYSVGLLLEKKNRFRLAIDYRKELWETYKSFGVSDSLANGTFVGVGIEMIPKHNVLSNFYEKIKYRIGFHYSQSALQIKNTQINEIGITFGFGIPIKQSGSAVNLGIELGQFGTTDNNLVKENYIKFTAGFTIFERWFIKRKYY